MSDRDNYLARASEARAAAEQATLDNVRERCLRSEEAWLSMARRLDKLSAMQEVNQAAKVEAAERTRETAS